MKIDKKRLGSDLESSESRLRKLKIQKMKEKWREKAWHRPPYQYKRKIIYKIFAEKCLSFKDYSLAGVLKTFET